MQRATWLLDTSVYGSHGTLNTTCSPVHRGTHRNTTWQFPVNPALAYLPSALLFLRTKPRSHLQLILKKIIYLLKKNFIYVAALGLSCGTWDLCWVMQDLLVWCRLSSSTACGILVPWPGIQPVFHELQGGFLTTGPLEKSFNIYICIYILI